MLLTTEEKGMLQGYQLGTVGTLLGSEAPQAHPGQVWLVTLPAAPC